MTATRPNNAEPQLERTPSARRRRNGFLCLVAIVAFAAVGLILWALPPSPYHFRLEAHFTFDGKPYTAVGYQKCTYRKSWTTSGTRTTRLKEPPTLQGYYTETWRDSPSVVLPDGTGAIMFMHAGTCPSLPYVTKEFVSGTSNNRGWMYPAYYFPDRSAPKTVWVLERPRLKSKPGRYVMHDYVHTLHTHPMAFPLAQNVPVAWTWYQANSARQRRIWVDPSFRPGWRSIPVWRGYRACVLMEDEWRARPEFVHAAKGVARTAVVDLNQPGQTWARNCPYGSRTPVLSLIPSDDYARATLDLDRGDLRWATITTPPEHHDKTAGLWRPEICIALEGCTGIQAGRPLWLYIPAREAFVRVEQTTLEAGNLTFFATRPGDTYIQ